MQRCTPVKHAGIYPGTSLEQELHQAALLGFHSQVQGSLSTGALLQGTGMSAIHVMRQRAKPVLWSWHVNMFDTARGPVARPDGGRWWTRWWQVVDQVKPHLYIDVGSILKQQFYEWLVPLQSGDVETGQTWGGGGWGLLFGVYLSVGTTLPFSLEGPLPTQCSNHRTIKMPPPKNPLRGLRGKELKVSTFSVMLLKLLCFKDQAAERQPQTCIIVQCTHLPLLTLDVYLQAQARLLRTVWGSS